MRIVGAQHLLDGKKLYVDFFDWTQPILLQSMRSVLAVSNIFGEVAKFLTRIGWQLLASPFAFLLVPGVSVILVQFFAFGLALLLTGLIAARADTKSGKLDNSAVLYMLAASLSALIVLYDFGDLQFMLLTGMLPWLYLRFERYKGKAFPLWLSTTTGLLAGFSACLDVTFLPVFLIVELVFLLRTLKWRCLAQPETAAFLLLPVLYASILALCPEPFHTQFWKWAMPLRLLQFSIDNESIYGPKSTPNRLDVLYTALSALAAASILKRESTLVAALASLLVSGFALYIMGGEGFSSELILVIFASLAIFLLCLEAPAVHLNNFLSLRCRAFHSKYLGQIVILLLALTGSTIVAGSLSHDRDLLVEESTKASNLDKVSLETAIGLWSNPGDTVTIFADYPEPAFPSILFLDRRSNTYFLSCRPLRYLRWLKERALLDRPLQDFHNIVHEQLENEIENTSACVVMLADAHEHEIFEKEKLLEALAKHYAIKCQSAFYFNHNNHQPREFVGFDYAYGVYRPGKP